MQLKQNQLELQELNGKLLKKYEQREEAHIDETTALKSQLT